MHTSPDTGTRNALTVGDSAVEETNDTHLWSSAGLMIDSLKQHHALACM